MTPNNPSSQHHSFTQTIWRNSLPNHEHTAVKAPSTKSTHNLSVRSVFRQRCRPSVYRQFWAKSFAPVDLPSSAIGTLCLNSPWHVYIPSFSLTLPRYFWLPPWAVSYFKDEQRCFVFIYLFLLFSIYYSFVPPSAARRQAGWADVMELTGTVLKPRRSICRSPSWSGLDVLLTLERRDHYGKLAWPCNEKSWVVLEEKLQLFST